MADFLAMGGYAAYVWPAWGAGVAVLAVITLHTLIRKSRARRNLAMLEMARTNPRDEDAENG